jgi:putative oxidoreductase
MHTVLLRRSGLSPFARPLIAVRAVANLWSALLSGIAWPYVELATRLWLAKLFFSFGAFQLMNWRPTLLLATQENPIPGLSPPGAALVSTAVYLICGALLGAGLMTRYAALPLLALSCVTQVLYTPFDTQLFWIVLSGWLVIHGAGPISLDNLLRRGLSESALSGVPTLIVGSQHLRFRMTPLYVSSARVWLGVALMVGAHASAHIVDLEMLARWLPLDVAMRIPMKGAWLGGTFLILGLGSRYVAAALLMCLVASSVVDPRATDSLYLLMLLSIIGIRGGGSISLDQMFLHLSKRIGNSGNAGCGSLLAKLPKVVIVGAGFGGLRCAQALRHAEVSVTLVDRTNYHLFQPLLYQVATAALSPGDIAAPTRQIFRSAPATRLLLGTVTGVDTRRQVVRTQSTEIPYDYLVLATGATHSYFGQEHWAPFAPGLKRIEDALEIRRRVLTAFESAEAATSDAERRALLTFLIVGGGPTGVELAGAIAELARFGLEQDFRAFDPASARVILVQAGPRLLPSFPDRLGRIALRSLEQLGVEVLVSSQVDHIDAQGVAIDGRRLEARTVLWAAGVAASPAARWVNAAADKAGRIVVADDLSVPELKNIFAIGDTAACNAWKGQPVPGLAAAAKQAGAYVAKQICSRIDDKSPLPAFRYRHYGSLATIGRKSAVVDFGCIRLWGAPAWWLWGVVHIGLLLGVRNRVSTLTNWFWAYLKFGGSIRLITGG